ncbi:alpha/beta hydrolase [Pseudomonas sp. HMWF032]|uniref:alpha/beta fold hydrolase n=1 Tax=Pseudomonas sp. HMWF032 TaxID=2056866 RepID=UPI000D39164D|nr:alpha/beta hydrolase [Pseudomonas sp. HMWF032]PTS83449.1 alpha/beta hydrolase [Pseudomonas sp. HMWF032]PTT85665.1 alpha/beta hydrolase [Pseudomonas sp. HMWF010]
MKKLIAGLALILIGSTALLYLSPAAQLASLQLIERQRAGLSLKQISVNNLNIHYYEGGPRNAQTILMVHGFAANKDNWLRFARHFSQDYRVIALDLPGFGTSEKPAGSYDVGTQAEHMASVIDALGIEQLHLIGNSMGGHINALYAARYPHRTRSLALLNNAGITSPQPSELMQLLQRGEPNPLVVKSPEDFQRLLQFIFVQPPYLPESLKGYFAEQAIANSAHYDQVFAHLIDRYIPLEPVLPKIQAPTLIIWGAEDRVLDVSSIDVMRPLLRDPRVVTLADTGHAPMIERPQLTAQHYRDFLQSLHNSRSESGRGNNQEHVGIKKPAQ